MCGVRIFAGTPAASAEVFVAVGVHTCNAVYRNEHMIIFFGRTETVSWNSRKTRYEELHLFYSLSSITWGDPNAVCLGERTGACRIFVGKPGREGLLGRAMRRWEDIIKMGLQEMGGFRLN
jgi:hypothetical protein